MTGVLRGKSGVRLCSRCKKEPARPGQRYGAKCHATEMREWRERHVYVRVVRADGKVSPFVNLGTLGEIFPTKTSLSKMK